MTSSENKNQEIDHNLVYIMFENIGSKVKSIYDGLKVNVENNTIHSRRKKRIDITNKISENNYDIITDLEKAKVEESNNELKSVKKRTGYIVNQEQNISKIVTNYQEQNVLLDSIEDSLATESTYLNVISEKQGRINNLQREVDQKKLVLDKEKASYKAEQAQTNPSKFKRAVSYVKNLIKNEIGVPIVATATPYLSKLKEPLDVSNMNEQQFMDMCNSGKFTYNEIQSAVGHVLREKITAEINAHAKHALLESASGLYASISRN